MHVTAIRTRKDKSHHADMVVSAECPIKQNNAHNNHIFALIDPPRL